jgi:hypothetical protein
MDKASDKIENINSLLLLLIICSAVEKNMERN